MDLPRFLFPRGPHGFLRLRARRIDFDLLGGRIASGRQVLEASSLRALEFQRGFLTLGDGGSWMTIDLSRYRDAAGPLISQGALSPSAVQLIEALRQTVSRNIESQGAAPPAADGAPLHLRYRVRVDRAGILITVVSLGIFLADLHHLTDEWLVSRRGLWWFLALAAAGTACLVLKRRVTRLVVDDQGVALKVPFRSRFYPWPEIRAFRHQHAEVELVGDNFRLPLALEILSAGSTPLILRRGRFAHLSLPGRRLFDRLRAKAPEQVEPPLALSSAERGRARWWIGGIVALNSAIFLLEKPFLVEGFEDRLRDMGARTGGGMHEPSRLLTALFLHGSLSHLFFNMLMLAVLGLWMGRLYGWPLTWSFYLGSGVLGNLIGDLLTRPGPEPMVAVGASTAILGLLGTLLAASWRWPERVPLAVRVRFRWAIPVTLLLTLGLGLVVPVLDNGAHLGGFFAGLLLAWPVPPRERRG